MKKISVKDLKEFRKGIVEDLKLSFLKAQITCPRTLSGKHKNTTEDWTGDKKCKYCGFVTNR